MSNEEMENIVKIFNSFKYFGILIKDNTQTIGNTVKEQIS